MSTISISGGDQLGRNLDVAHEVIVLPADHHNSGTRQCTRQFHYQPRSTPASSTKKQRAIVLGEKPAQLSNRGKVQLVIMINPKAAKSGRDQSGPAWPRSTSHVFSRDASSRVRKKKTGVTGQIWILDCAWRWWRLEVCRFGGSIDLSEE